MIMSMLLVSYRNEKQNKEYVMDVMNKTEGLLSNC